MNLYQSQHPFYCGIDLHAKQMYACVVDQSGKKQLHRNFKTRQSEKFFADIEPFGRDIVIGCESTFNWYWLADACAEKQIPFVLGHALYLKAIHGGKVKNDKVDSEKLRSYCEVETSPPLTPTPKNCEPPVTCSADALT